jgi:DHA3 family macrolide efflux protein-like MFS transporter
MAAPDKLWNKNFLLLWQGQFISEAGSQAYVMAMLLWLKRTTESATLIGLLMTLSVLPGILLGPIGGTIADRHSRRKLLVLTDLLSGAVVLLLAGLLFLRPQGTDLEVVAFCAGALLLGVLGAVFNPTVVAALPDIVPRQRLSSANSLFQSSLQIAKLIAQGLSGVLFRLLGAPLVVLLNGLSYVFAGVCETFIRIPQAVPAPASAAGAAAAGDAAAAAGTGGFKSQLYEGFGYVWRRNGLRLLFGAVGAIRFFVVPVTILLPFYVADHLKVAPDWFGFLVAGFGAGVIIGYLLAGAVRTSGRATTALVLGCMVAMSLLLGSLGLITSPVAALAVLAAAGGMNGLLSVKVVSILQITTPTEMRGRVFGLLNTVGEGLTPAALLLAGVVADATGRKVSLIYAGCGAILALITLIVAMSRDLRDLISSGDETAAPPAAGQPAAAAAEA